MSYFKTICQRNQQTNFDFQIEDHFFL